MLFWKYRARFSQDLLGYRRSIFLNREYDHMMHLPQEGRSIVERHMIAKRGIKSGQMSYLAEYHVNTDYTSFYPFPR
jgi:hypothetical protein